MRKHLGAIVAIVVLIAIPAFAVPVFRTDVGIIESAKITLEDNRKILDKNVVSNLDGLTAIKELQKTYSSYKDIQNLNKKLNKYSRSLSSGVSKVSGSNKFSIDSTSKDAKRYSKQLLNGVMDTSDVTKAILDGKLDKGSLSGKTGTVYEITEDKNQGPHIALSNAVSRSVEANKVRYEKLVGDDLDSNISGTTSDDSLSSFLSTTSSETATVTYTADGTTYISYGDSDNVIKKTETEQTIISRSEADSEMLSAGILTTTTSSISEDITNTTEASIQMAAAQARLDMAFPGQTTELRGAILAIAEYSSTNPIAQTTLVNLGSDMVKTTMAGAGAEIEEKYRNEDSENEVSSIFDLVGAEINSQADELLWESGDSAEKQTARALGTIVRQQSALIGMTKQIALQQLDIIDLTGLTLNAASMKMWNNMQNNVLNRTILHEALPATYYQKQRENS